MVTGLKFLAAVAAFGAVVLGSAAANANPIQFVYSVDGGATYTQFGAITTNGFNSPSTTAGTYTISATAFGSPMLTAPNFQSSTIDFKSTGAGTLIVAALEYNLTTPGLSGYNVSFTNNAQSSVAVTGTFAVINSGTYTALTSATLAPGVATSTTFVPYTSSPDYTIVELYTATFGAAGGIVNATFAESGRFNVPEPMSMSLLGAGLAGVGLIRLRRKSV